MFDPQMLTFTATVGQDVEQNLQKGSINGKYLNTLILIATIV